GNPVQKQAQAKTNPKASTASSSGGGGRASAGGGGSGKASSKPGGNTGASTRSNGGSSGGNSCEDPGNSFAPGTNVLMADGTTKPIEQVKPGDTVIATDPETGTTSV
ncbi:hypothetical protein, partial [Micromonospora sp. LOL_021]|uniref:hypothetical protein n=1 Tax=Micromonospora sp. LOL_021 TaxID=3345417 RepID=UPI003A898035